MGKKCWKKINKVTNYYENFVSYKTIYMIQYKTYKLRLKWIVFYKITFIIFGNKTTTPKFVSQNFYICYTLNQANKIL